MSIQLKKSVKKYVSTLIILSCSAALLSASCFAEEKKEKGSVASEGVSKEIGQLIDILPGLKDGDSYGATR